MCTNHRFIGKNSSLDVSSVAILRLNLAPFFRGISEIAMMGPPFLHGEFEPSLFDAQAQ